MCKELALLRLSTFGGTPVHYTSTQVRCEISETTLWHADISKRELQESIGQKGPTHTRKCNMAGHYLLLLPCKFVRNRSTYDLSLASSIVQTWPWHTRRCIT